MNLKIKNIPAFTIAILAGPFLSVARAADGVWSNSAAGGLWSDPLNWSGDIIADGTDSTADFGALDLIDDNTLQLDSARTIGNLTFGDIDGTSAAGWIVGNNGNPSNVLTFDAATPTITVNPLGSGKSATISAVIGGTGGLNKAGAGTLVLGAANTYSGGTMIGAGILAIANAGALGGGNIAIGDAMLQVNYLGTGSPVLANTISVASGKIASLDVIGSGVANNTLTIGTGSITLNGTLRVTRSAGSNGATDFSGALSGSGMLEIGNTQAGITPAATTGLQGRARFTNANAFTKFTGDVRILNGGNLMFSGTVGTTLSGQDLTIDAGGYVTLLGAGVTAFVGELTGAGSITKNAGTSAATVSIASGNFSGTIHQSLLSGAGTTSVIKTSPNTLILSGTNGYTGATTISSGTLQIGAGGTTGSLASGSAISVASGATLAFNRSNAHTVANVISGAGSISVSGAGAVTLSGNNPTFTGNVSVASAGATTSKLTIGNSNSLTASTVTLAAGTVTGNGGSTTLELSNGVTLGSGVTVNLNSTGAGDFRSGINVPAAATATLNSAVVLNGSGSNSISSAGTLTVGGNLIWGGGGYTGILYLRGTGSGSINGTINLPGAALSKTDAGTWTVNSSGNITASVNVLVGSLALGADNALPATAPMSLGQTGTSTATFDLKGFSQTVGGLQVNVGTGIKTVTNSVTGTPVILTVNQNTDSLFDSTGRITGALGLTKDGNGALTIAGPGNTYSGPTVVNSGSLIVNGEISGSSVTVESGGTLAGSGSISGSVVANAGGTIAPGSSPGQLDTGALTLNAGAILEIEIGGAFAGTQYDQLNVTGAIALGGDLSFQLINGFEPQLSDQFWIALNDDVDPIFGTFGNVPITDLANGLGTFSFGGNDWLVYYGADFDTNSVTGGNDIMLVVPEPSSVMMLIAGVGMAFGKRRRRVV